MVAKLHNAKKWVRYTGFIALIVFLLFLPVLTLYVLFFSEQQDYNYIKNENLPQYEKHFVVVVQEPTKIIWQEFMRNARQYAEEKNIMLEVAGEYLDVHYAATQLIEIATSAKVDGIIVEADPSIIMRQRIDKAVAQGIPIVTILSDSEKSKRQTFIDIGYFELGREYARQIIDVAGVEMEKVSVLLDTAENKIHLQEEMIQGIETTLKNEGNHLKNLNISYKLVDRSKIFAAEIAIREIFSESKLPEIMICLNAEDTLLASEIIKEKELSDMVKLFGYQGTEEALKKVAEGEIQAVITMNASTMAVASINALLNHDQKQDDLPILKVEVNSITPKNIRNYLHE